MPETSQIPLPETALLGRYENRPGHHTDCYVTEVSQRVDIATFSAAFFNSPVMRLERRLFALMSYPSSLADVQALAEGRSDTFAGWVLEDRNAHQLLLKIFEGGVRTWLMVSHSDTGTRLYFGSAVLPKDPQADQPKLGIWVKALMGFHHVYSKILLRAARKQLARQAHETKGRL